MKKLYCLACLFLTGCSTYGVLSPIEGHGQKIVIEDGHEVLYSLKSNLVAIALPSTVESDTRVRAYVQVGNGTKYDFEFSPSDVSFTDAVGTEKESIHHVYTYEELLAEEQTRQMWQMVALAFSAAGNAMAASNAGYSYSNGYYSGNYSGNIYGGYGNHIGGYDGMMSGTYSSVTYDPAKAQMARDLAEIKTNQMMASVMQNSQDAMQSLARSILKRNTVLPGGICGGQVEFDGPVVFDTPTEIEFQVTTGEERHVFKYSLRKVE